jgi:hypothetical protein
MQEERDSSVVGEDGVALFSISAKQDSKTLTGKNGVVRRYCRTKTINIVIPTLTLFLALVSTKVALHCCANA